MKPKLSMKDLGVTEQDFENGKIMVSAKHYNELKARANALAEALHLITGRVKTWVDDDGEWKTAELECSQIAREALEKIMAETQYYKTEKETACRDIAREALAKFKK